MTHAIVSPQPFLKFNVLTIMYTNSKNLVVNIVLEDWKLYDRINCHKEYWAGHQALRSFKLASLSKWWEVAFSSLPTDDNHMNM